MLRYVTLHLIHRRLNYNKTILIYFSINIINIIWRVEEIYTNLLPSRTNYVQNWIYKSFKNFWLAYRFGNFIPSFLQSVYTAIRERRANLQHTVVIVQNSIDISDCSPFFDSRDPGRHVGTTNNLGNN